MLNLKKQKRYMLTAGAVWASAVLQAMVLQTLLNSANLLPGGFTGIAVILEMFTKNLGFPVGKSVWLVLLNVPVAALCWKHIGKKFVIFSLVQIFLTSIFLDWIPEKRLFEDILLNICFGGFLFGLSLVIALRGNASTGGMDFIALYVSNRLGKSIWQQVFLFNAAMICVFGAVAGWEYAGYSILFQFISTQTVDRFYHRFKRVTLQITTEHPDELVEAYISFSRHGISVLDGHGGYSRRPMSILHTVVSSYEVQDIVHHLRGVDEKIIINVLPTENFFGAFYFSPVE